MCKGVIKCLFVQCSPLPQAVLCLLKYNSSAKILLFHSVCGDFQFKASALFPEDTVAIDSSLKNNNNFVMLSSKPFFGLVIIICWKYLPYCTCAAFKVFWSK